MNSPFPDDARYRSEYAVLAERLVGHRVALNYTVLQLDRTIAIGSYGAVFHGFELSQDKLTGRSFAVKCLLRNHCNTFAETLVQRETSNHTAVQHPNVAPVYHVLDHRQVVFLVMPYYPDGDLFKAIVDRREFVGRDDDVRSAWLQVAEAVRACHSRGVFHRDVKPENVLIRRSLPSPDSHLLLADFGLSTTDEWSFEFGVTFTRAWAGALNPDRPNLNSAECFRRQISNQIPYSSRLADVWALGVVLVNLSCARNPWFKAEPNEATFAAYCSNNDYLRYILPITNDLNNVLKRVFRLDPTQRITLTDFIDEVRRIRRFTLDYQELSQASEPVKTAAGSLMKVRWEQEVARTQETGFRERDERDTENHPVYAPTQDGPQDFRLDQDENKTGLWGQDKLQIPYTSKYSYRTPAIDGELELGRSDPPDDGFAFGNVPLTSSTNTPDLIISSTFNSEPEPLCGTSEFDPDQFMQYPDPDLYDDPPPLTTTSSPLSTPSSGLGTPSPEDIDGDCRVPPNFNSLPPSLYTPDDPKEVVQKLNRLAYTIPSWEDESAQQEVRIEGYDHDQVLWADDERWPSADLGVA
ncbi:hypothetical protein FRB90_001682 [Tulasnella sp. 427]|nr:hypothetical protein FRB90_001682 [Tulasnella sp. 427]